MGISPAVQQEIQRQFLGTEAELVESIFLEADEAIADSERIQFAILKLAQGDLNEFDKAFELATIDWRDVLVAAGLASMDWPEVVVAEGLADEEWRRGLT